MNSMSSMKNFQQTMVACFGLTLERVIPFANFAREVGEEKLANIMFAFYNKGEEGLRPYTPEELASAQEVLLALY